MSTGRVLRAALWLMTALGAPAALAFGQTQAQPTIRIRGRALDPAGHPVENVQVTLTPGPRRVVSFDNGDFDIPGLAVGTYTLTARRIGYQSASVSVFARDSITRVTITLVPIPRELDSIRIREKASGLRYAAVVLDQNDQPVTNAEVVVPGARRSITTDSLGRFSVSGLGRGTVIVQVRKIGYARYFNSMRMLAERADTIYMARLPQTMTAVQIKELGGFGMDYWAHRDMQERQAWKGMGEGAVSREELAQQGKVDLCDALPSTASGTMMHLHNDPFCKRFPDGVRAILIDGVRCVHTLLSDFDADEVEMVEVMRKDWSGTLVARHCAFTRPAYVIWTRKNPDIKLQQAAAVPKDSVVLRRDTTHVSHPAP